MDDSVIGSIEVTRLPGGVVEIAARGEVDLSWAHEVRDAVAEVLTTSRPFRIELNMRSVSFIDSGGIGALVAAFQTAEVCGVKLIVTQPSRVVHNQLWGAGLLGLFGAPEPYRGGVPGQGDRALAGVSAAAAR
ncbi:MAG TPA: STAS domain-containing protein [Pilimelia sp.]|nr:STAS domain-containing protein [Pilimelia sp.]